MPQCIPCLAPEAKKLLLDAFSGNQELSGALRNLPNCTEGVIFDPCAQKGAQGHRGRSLYQDFVSKCLKSKDLKGFGKAPQAIKECAASWQKQKVLR